MRNDTRDFGEEQPSPQDLQAEQGVLGAMLVEHGAAVRALALLTREAFYPEAHQVIFQAMATVAATGQPVDLITVSGELRRRGLLENIGGAQYLTAIISEVPTAAHVVPYARRVHECYQLREAITAAARIDADARGQRRTSAEVLAAGADALAQIASRGLQVVPPYVTGPELRARMGEVQWWWPGWLPKDMLVMLAGRQGVGKSGVALFLALAMSSGMIPWPDASAPPGEPRRVVWVDTEGAQQVLADRLGNWGGIDDRLIIPGEDGTESIHIDDAGDVERLARLVEHTNAAMVVIDSLAAAHRAEENTAAMGPIVTALGEQIARDQHCTVLLVHHVRKGAEALEWDDVRGSGSITGPVRVGLLVDRPDPEGAMRLRVAKSNIGRKPKALGYRPEEHAIPAWCDAPLPPREDGPAEGAEAWLRMKLSRGPLRETVLFGAGRDAGHAQNATRQALSRMVGSGVALRQLIGGQTGYALVETRREVPDDGRY